jgi:hypothetical protein
MWLSAWWRKPICVRRLESIQCSYKARKSCLMTAGLVLACPSSLTMLTQEVAGLETVRLPGRYWVPASLHAQPATLLRGRRWESSCNTPGLQPSTPGEGEAWRRWEELHTGGGVDDRLGCWVMSLLPPPPRPGGVQ